jgi:hypothetical protein
VDLDVLDRWAAELRDLLSVHLGVLAGHAAILADSAGADKRVGGAA